MARRRALSADEKALWSRIAATAQPLHPSRREPDGTLPEPVSRPAIAPRGKPQSDPIPPFRIGGHAGKPSGTRIDLLPDPGYALHAQPLRMDHKTHRQMSRGKIAPDARIDLHGMTLNIAQPVLTRFIMNARSDGHRLVLVITGKGRDAGADAPLPVRAGALRHNVPHWLHMPPLDQMILQVRPAHRRHGGDGAYYVYLRR